MYFYIDESGHTGPNLFDEKQPVLYYGVLSSRFNLDVLALKKVLDMRIKTDAPRLHASELGFNRIALIAEDLIFLQKKYDLRFDCYRIIKKDLAVISFFDQIFDQGINPAMTWSGYWTPMRYFLLLKLAYLFDEKLSKLAWNARISVNAEQANNDVIFICDSLIERLNQLPDIRSRQLIGDTLRWARENINSIGYNTYNKRLAKQVTPNLIGFQSVIHGINQRIKKNNDRYISKVVVDRQSQFNKAQKSLVDHYNKLSGKSYMLGAGLPEMDLKNMFSVPLTIKGGNESPGLELVDIYLWIFKRIFQQQSIPLGLKPIIDRQNKRGYTDEVSLKGIEDKCNNLLKEMPEMSTYSLDELEKIQKLLATDEERRVKY